MNGKRIGYGIEKAQDGETNLKVFLGEKGGTRLLMRLGPPRD